MTTRNNYLLEPHLRLAALTTIEIGVQKATVFIMAPSLCPIHDAYAVVVLVANNALHCARDWIQVTYAMGEVPAIRMVQRKAPAFVK